MNIIITGISGFVGQNLSNYLRKKSFLIDSLSLRNQFLNFNSNADAIVHLAGKAHDTKGINDASEYFAINTELTKKLFDAFLKSNVKDFIYFSSVKAVADNVSDILDEDIEPKPKTPYGQSKLSSEEYLLSKEIPDDKRVIIIRPCMIHGPGNKGNLNLLYNVIKNRIPYPLAAFHNERSFLGIDNLNFLIEKILLSKKITSGIYNFADDEVLSTNELIEIISSVLNKKKVSIAFHKEIINTVAKVGDLINLPMNSENVQKLTENYRVSNKKIKLALEIDKLPNTAQKGLEKTIKSFKKK
ncbi:NAD-dependent epimerase/dehydratase family protein [Flavobacterium hydrophilum]|uniref:Nucleoside-diphosphate-sugar epimerase n=1 Tax=Flavobacterium hydrophilum TaxID=2211445 RepID=A0A2V4BZM3_9FLAO|nr:NAD-dependent epimerase/dehydratase family protein [Flavobacterium hydrophilum]PXY44062.1 nucleoside-diphosphate-sugar epimerase [Flavobacterium hydrophilum]